MDTEEKAEIQEWREKAKKELNDWYERRDEQLGKTQTSNRYYCLRQLKSTNTSLVLLSDLSQLLCFLINLGANLYFLISLFLSRNIGFLICGRIVVLQKFVPNNITFHQLDCSSNFTNS